MAPIASTHASSRSMRVGLRAPRFQPSPHGWTRQPAAASAWRNSIVVRSVATKPGMTSAGGPSSGPRGPVWPETAPQRARRASRLRAAARHRRRRDRPGPLREILRPHQLLQRLGQAHAAVLGLVIFQQRNEDPRARQRRIVERVREAHLAVAAAVADVRAPRLPVVQRRAAVGLAIFAQARHPALDVVHAIFAEAHVAGRGLDHLIGDFERLQAGSRPARAAARAMSPTAPRRPRRSHIARP